MIGRHTSRVTRLLAHTALLLGVALGAAGCTSSTGSQPTAQTPAPVSSQPKTQPVRTTQHAKRKQVPGAGVKVPAKVDNVVAVRKDVTLDACLPAQGGWAASGEAVNHGSTGTSYKITVFFTDKTATVIGTGATSVNVPAGKVARWRIATRLTPQPGGTRCVLVGVAK